MATFFKADPLCPINIFFWESLSVNIIALIFIILFVSLNSSVTTSTEYGISLRKFNKGYLQAIEAEGYPPSIIGEKVVEIMKTNKPKTRYVITRKIFKNYYIPGFLPDRWVDRLIGKMLGLIKK